MPAISTANTSSLDDITLPKLRFYTVKKQQQMVLRQQFLRSFRFHRAT
jgi:hypothetical protein